MLPFLPLAGLGLPKWIWAAGAIVVAGGAVYLAGYSQGRAAATEAATARIEKINAQHAEREREQFELVASANRRTRDLEVEHERRVATLRSDFAAEQAAAAEHDARVIADLRNGHERLRLQVTSCREARPTPAGPTAPGTDGGGTAELAPEAAAILWGIARDGDRAVRKLTALQAWARDAVLLCSGTEPTEGQ